MSRWVRPPKGIANNLRIGLLGGSFNPAHAGHIHVSEAAIKRLHLDFVWWLVSPGNPLKPSQGMAPFEKRVSEARAIVRNPRIVVSEIEAGLGTRYTVDTIAALKNFFPGVRFVWLMGSDNLVQFSRWRNWQRIFQLVPICAVARPGSALAARFSKAALRFARFRKQANDTFTTRRPPAWTIIETKRHPASATALRSRSAW